MIKKTLLFIFNAHVPYIRDEHAENSGEESRFFELLSYGLLPFLRMCGQLEEQAISFKCGLIISPIVCELLADTHMQNAYVDYLDKHIAFVQHELQRLKNDEYSCNLISMYHMLFQQARHDYVGVYQKDIIKKINYFAEQGEIELIATAATPCFFPLYQSMPEALLAQIETGLVSFNQFFSTVPAGFWLPAMGYNAGIERILKNYGIHSTILESQSFLLADNCPSAGVFFPATSENGFTFFAKDAGAYADIAHAETGMYQKAVYLDTDCDIGFDLEANYLAPLFEVAKGRRSTGFCYQSRGAERAYDKKIAYITAEQDATAFLHNRCTIMNNVSELLNKDSLCSVSVFPLQFLGKTWFEGMHWLEYVFRSIAASNDMTCLLPSEYLKTVRQVQTIVPFYSSSLPSGYADELVNNTNDWMFSCIHKTIERMVDLADRFPNDPGVKERILNMAAREVLLAQSLDWPLSVYTDTFADYAAKRCKEHIQSFTAAYEALGSGAVSTEWLIQRERKYPLFSSMDYRCFKKRI